MRTVEIMVIEVVHISVFLCSVVGVLKAVLLSPFQPVGLHALRAKSQDRSM